jgi:antitoxin component YwqK of YwqJK toxin-antitoxin module
MFVNKIFIIGSLFLVFACQEKEKVVYTYYEDGKVKEAIEISDDTIRNGTCKSYYQSGKLAEISNYYRGVLNGEKRIFYENGNLKGIENYVEGKMNGEFMYFFENGNIETSGKSKNGIVYGTALNFFEYDSGRISIEADFLIVNGESVRTRYVQFNKDGDTLRASPYVQIEMEDSIAIDKDLKAKIRLINPEYKFTHFVITDFNKESLDNIAVKFDTSKSIKHETLVNVDTSQRGIFYLRGVAIHHSVIDKKGNLIYTEGDFNIYFEKKFVVY